MREEHTHTHTPAKKDRSGQQQTDIEAGSPAGTQGTKMSHQEKRERDEERLEEKERGTAPLLRKKTFFFAIKARKHRVQYYRGGQRSRRVEHCEEEEEEESTHFLSLVAKMQSAPFTCCGPGKLVGFHSYKCFTNE